MEKMTSTSVLIKHYLQFCQTEFFLVSWFFQSPENRRFAGRNGPETCLRLKVSLEKEEKRGSSWAHALRPLDPKNLSSLEKGSVIFQTFTSNR
jgi:hypothetical protein